MYPLTELDSWKGMAAAKKSFSHIPSSGLGLGSYLSVFRTPNSPAVCLSHLCAFLSAVVMKWLCVCGEDDVVLVQGRGSFLVSSQCY